MSTTHHAANFTVNLRRVLAGAVAIAGLSLLSGAASAESLTVKFEDLNLASEQGVATLYSRLQAASRAVCRDFDGQQLRQKAERRQCYAEALSGAVAQVNHSSITALHMAKRNVRVAQSASDGERRS